MFALRHKVTGKFLQLSYWWDYGGGEYVLETDGEFMYVVPDVSTIVAMVAEFNAGANGTSISHPTVKDQELLDAGNFDAYEVVELGVKTC